ncbi:MAG TPA: hypothetical protein VGH19_20845 [Verrucomicrobiae bacterium]
MRDHLRRFLAFCLWLLTFLGLAAIAFIVGYSIDNRSGHTGWEPLIALFLYLPLALVGMVCFALRRRFAGIAAVSISAIVVGLVGATLVITLDRTNQLVQYERWLQRGMPAPK